MTSRSPTSHVGDDRKDMLTTLKPILAKAHRGQYAVGAFNINNLEALRAILDAAVVSRAPVIVQTSEGAIEYAGMDELGGMVYGAVKDVHYARVPIVFHLDHGKDPALVERAIRSGWYTSVMIDGSAHPYRENVRITKKIVALAHARGISVEAELGSIAGIEDLVSVKERDAKLTNPVQARRFVRDTKCDALAVAIGTSHGAFKFKSTPHLDIARLQRIRSSADIPLVLHGASGVPHHAVASLKTSCTILGDCDRLPDARGVPDGIIHQAVRAGINKVNIDTDLRIAFTDALRRTLLVERHTIDPRKLLSPSRAEMQKVVTQKMKLLGCAGRW